MDKAERIAKYGAEIEKMHGKLKLSETGAVFEKPQEVKEGDHLQAYYEVKQIVDDAKAQRDRAMAILDIKEPELEALYAKVKDQLDAIEAEKVAAEAELREEVVIDK